VSVGVPELGLLLLVLAGWGCREILFQWRKRRKQRWR
jgi:hypothetical protein